MNKKFCRQNKLYLVNGQDPHPRIPYGKNNAGTRLKWYTYGQPLDPDASVERYHRPNHPQHLEYPWRLKSHIDKCTGKCNARVLRPRSSPIERQSAPKRVSPSAQEENSPSPVKPTGMATQTTPVGKFDKSVSVPTPIPETPLDQQNKRRRIAGKEVTIDPTDLETRELSLEELCAGYAVVKRMSRFDDGVTIITFPPQITLNNKFLTYAHVVKRTTDEIDGRASRKHARAAEWHIKRAGNDDFNDGLEMVAKRNKESYREVGRRIKLILPDRMSALDSLTLMSSANLTYAQYRMVAKIISGSTGVDVLAPESQVRANITADDPVEFESGRVELIVKDKSTEVAFGRVVSLFESMEKYVAMVYQKPELLRDDLERIPESDRRSPLADTICIKLMCDKGGNSTKFGWVLIQRKNANSANNFQVLAEYEGPDDHDSLNTVIFSHFSEELNFLPHNPKIAICLSGDCAVAKILPSEFQVNTTASGAPMITIIDEQPQEVSTLVDYGNAGMEVEGTFWSYIQLGDSLIGVGLFMTGTTTPQFFFEFRTPLKVFPELKVTVKVIKPFIAGDYAFYCELCGHQGSSAMFPCVWCQASDKNDIQKGSWRDLSPKPKARSLSLMHGHFTKYNASVKKTPKIAQSVFNITKRPLLSSVDWNDMLYIAPIVLHLFLGTIVKLYDLLLKDVRQQLDGLDVNHCQLLQQIQETNDFISGLEKDIKNVTDSQQKNIKSLAALQGQAKSLLKNQVLNVSETTAMSKGVSKENFDRAQTLKALVNEVRIKKDEDTIALQSLKKELERYKTRVEALNTAAGKPGQFEEALEKFLQHHDIRRQAYYSGAFVGNHVNKLLLNFNGMWDFLYAAAEKIGTNESESASVYSQAVANLVARLQPIWSAFAKLHDLARACRLLSDREVEELCDACHNASNEARKAYPGVHVQLKLHIIEAHLPPFVKHWRSAGLFAEDAVESIHALVNRLNRRFACLHGDLKQTSKMTALETLGRCDVQSRAQTIQNIRKRGPYKKKTS
uniref:Uncharacterized protein n=1 Tax=Aureoumbra lagunensis TaxID=44058 RepID=A0A7S3NMG1_9STRA